MESDVPMQKDIKGEGGEGQKEEEGRKENKTTFTSGQARILLPKLICVHVLRNRSSGSNQIFVKKTGLSVQTVQCGKTPKLF